MVRHRPLFLWVGGFLRIGSEQNSQPYARNATAHDANCRSTGQAAAKRRAVVPGFAKQFATLPLGSRLARFLI